MQASDERFFEEFKRLEQLCGEIYSRQGGVSAYIADMEDRAAKGRAAVPTWDADLKSLKHLRWVRNRLAHDTVPDRLSEAEDLAFLRDFRRRILDGRDPLALLEKARREQRQPAPGRQAGDSRQKGQGKETARPRDGKGKNRFPPLLAVLILAALILLLFVLWRGGYGEVLFSALREIFPSRP